MNKGLTFGAGLGLGLGIMFLLDPDRGKRRRAMLRDKCVRAARKTGETMEGTARDLSNRTHGIISKLESHFSSGPVDDSIVVDRVRSKLGRVVSHPRAIEVGVLEGNVTLAGPILANEVDDLLSATKRVSGVIEVINNLEVHERSDNHPALQGGH